MSKIQQTCRWCGIDKPEGKFDLDKFSDTGRNPVCKLCFECLDELRAKYTGETPLYELAVAWSKEVWKNKQLKINGY